MPHGNLNDDADIARQYENGNQIRLGSLFLFLFTPLEYIYFPPAPL